MEKQERNFKLNYQLDWAYGVEISQLKKDIEELEKLGATHVEIESVTSYDSSYIEIDAYCKRIETDEEFNQRKKELDMRKEKMKQRELKQLEELISKYGI